MKTYTQDVGGKVISSGCDYLTFSMVDDDSATGEMMEKFDAAMMNGDEGGNEPRQTKHGCYSGWACGQYFHGEHKGRRGFRVSGSASPAVLQWILDNRSPVRPSRVDLRVDVQRCDEPVGFANELRSMVRAAENRRAAWRPKTLKLYEGSKGDDSLYLNSPKGDHYGVRYFKSKQDRTVILPNVLRDEIRYGEDYAKRIFEVLKADNEPQQTAIDAATDFYKKFGIDPCYSVPAREFRLPVLERKTEDEVFAEWFIANIAPRIGRMENEQLRGNMARAMRMRLPLEFQQPDASDDD
jgi:hypothetical protein